MTIGFGSRFLGVGLLVCTALLLPACGDDGGGKSKSDGGMDAGEDEDAGTMEEDASTARDASADAAGDSSTPAPDAADPYTCEPPPGPDGSVAEGEPCCEGLGRCFALPEDGGVSLAYGDCDPAENLRCVPLTALGDSDGGAGDGGAGDGGAGDGGTGDGGAGGPVKCRMKPAGSPDGGPDYEGRCVHACFVGPTTLEQGECSENFLCVPCYNLITGASTGACDNPGDQPDPSEPVPPGFDECGEERGYCVSAANIGDAGATLQQLTCGEDELCTPKTRVTAPDSCFPRCESIVGAGACVPAFLIPEASRGFLQPATCETGDLCSPCINPTNMMPTGACN